ncbi:MAG: LysM peptidoglycan-binding domain-containing protein [Bacteroidetes bacterium]|nr:LysM peptidoglycan-binding domain-containing protein [Bacteroidota bacterium]
MAAKQIVRARKHKVQNGESIRSLARKAGINWRDLARFNWGTAIPEKINKFLRKKVGCFKRTRDEKNYIFTSDDDPGIVYIPEMMPYTFGTDSIHELTVKLPDSKTFIQSDCIVRFRPKPNWQGEYGFDWMRDDLHYVISTAPSIGNNLYKDITGKHYKDAAKTILHTGVNDYSNNFKPDINNYFDLEEDEYYKGSDIKFTDGTVFGNYASFLSLYMKDEDGPVHVDIQAMVTIKTNTLDELRFEIQPVDSGKITVYTPRNLFKISPGQHELPLRIELKRTLSSDLLIKALAVTRNADGSDKVTLVGRLFIVANDLLHRKTKKILVVDLISGPVSWQPLGTGGKKPLVKNTQKDNLVTFLHQALIHPELEFVELDVSSDTAFINKYTYNNELFGYKEFDNNFTSIDDELANRLVAKFGDTYKDHIKIFYMGYDGGCLVQDSHGVISVEALGGYSSGPHQIVLFDVSCRSVFSHEVLHSLNLSHTFYNLAKYTYKVFETENIMDYTNIKAGMIDSSICLYHWQWQIANKSADNEAVIGDFNITGSNFA